MKIKRMALLPAMLFSFFTHAQVNDTLREVKVRAGRQHPSADERVNRFLPGQKLAVVDSITLQQYAFQSLSNLLAQQLPVFVKSYGLNGLATLNFRGASAAQSQVYWNGIPIQNAASGITDVSLLRTSSFQKINIVYGGSSALWGSGNVGGALLLESTQPYFDTAGVGHLGLSATAGSYGQLQASLNATYSSQRFYLSGAYSMQTAKNNFRYSYNDSSYETMNSRAAGMVAQLTGAYKINQRNVVSLHAWMHGYEREIPKAVFESLSVKRQQDTGIRAVMSWDNNTEANHVYAKAAYLYDAVHFTDSAVLMDTRNAVSQFFAETGIRLQFREHHQLMVFAPLQYAYMQRPVTKDAVSQSRVALAAAYALSLPRYRMKIAVNGRAMLIDRDAIPLGGINIAYAPLRWLTIRGNVQRSYRAATLNELYYVPGGNEKLRPEQGWSKDAGYLVKTNTTKRLALFHDVSYFNRTMHDWIIWFGGAIWTPHNIATVNSRGVETENRIQLRVKKAVLHIGLNTAYVLATTTQSYVPGDGSIGKQIPYAPRYNGQINIGLSFVHLYVNYNHTYTGYRFITVDESAWLLPYQTGNVQLSYTLPVKKSILLFSVNCNNAWAAGYMVVGGRPMPGRNWLAGITYTR